MDQTRYLKDAEDQLGLTPTLMAEQMAIPYDSYKDLKSGRRKLRDIHVRLVGLLLTVHAGKASELQAERKALKTANKEFDARLAELGRSRV